MIKVESKFKDFGIQIPTDISEITSEALGTVSRSATKVVEGLNTEVTYTATPKLGSRFVKWVEVSGGTETDVADTDPTLTITVNAAETKTYKAVFSSLSHTEIN